MKRLDEWLIERFEAFCHRTQRLAGITALLWLRLSLVLAGAQLTAMALRWPSYWFPVLLCVARFLITFTQSPQQRHGEELTANPEKHKWRVVRPASLIFALVALPFDYAIDRNLWYQCAVIGFYFEACDDLPPGISKLRSALNSLARTFGASVNQQEPCDLPT